MPAPVRELMCHLSAGACQAATTSLPWASTLGSDEYTCASNLPTFAEAATPASHPSPCLLPSAYTFTFPPLHTTYKLGFRHASSGPKEGGYHASSAACSPPKTHPHPLRLAML
eukprot:1160641-Pelagomonas_calceolata.AAC.5